MSAPQAGPAVTIHAHTDPGSVRDINEDNHFVGQTVFAVADGMGGHVAGEVASRLALEPVAELDGTTFDSDEEAQASLVAVIHRANDRVVTESTANSDLAGMGTTLTAALLRDGVLHLAHIGDSRGYLLRRGRPLQQLTVDHTLVEQLVREGRITREEAAVHPQRSVIMRCIGIADEIEVDSLPHIVLEPGDQVLLCSDGLDNAGVTDEQLASILEAKPDGEQAVQDLVSAALASGAPDNVTVLLLRAEDDGRAAAPPDDPGSRAAAPDDEDDTQQMPPPVGQPPSRTSQGATPIRTRQESGDDGDWAAKLGRYGSEQGQDTSHTPDPRTRRRGRVLGAGVGAVVLIAVLLIGGYTLLARAYFVGEDTEGQVVIFNGLPPESVGGLPLHWERESTDLQTADLATFEAGRVQEGLTASSLSEAREIVERYRARVQDEQDDQDAIDPDATATPSPGPDATPTP